MVFLSAAFQDCAKAFKSQCFPLIWCLEISLGMWSSLYSARRVRVTGTSFALALSVGVWDGSKLHPGTKGRLVPSTHWPETKYEALTACRGEWNQRHDSATFAKSCIVERLGQTSPLRETLASSKAALLTNPLKKSVAVGRQTRNSFCMLHLNVPGVNGRQDVNE